MSAMSDADILAATDIPPLSHAEAGAMAMTELERFLACVRSLGGDDWGKPTDCSLWNVRQVLAHQAGAYAAFASWGQFVRQWSQVFKKRRPEELPVDLVNRLQVEDRANASPAELVGELQEVGPQAIATRQRLPAFLRALRVPFGPPLGFVPVSYLTDLIYTRDTWSHRLDICRATGREMILTPDHDGQMMALVMRDLAAKLHRKGKGISVGFHLTGLAGGSWRIGSLKSRATLHMDALIFSRLTSGRLSPDEVWDRSLVVIDGDPGMARQALNHATVPY